MGEFFIYRKKILGGAMNRGTVKWFCPEQGFGVIMNDKSKMNLFVHFSEIISDGFESLIEGQKVIFSTKCDERNSSQSRAVNVYIL